jgi:hypothetical protein
MSWVRCKALEERDLWAEPLLEGGAPPAQMGAETGNDSAPIIREGPTAIRIEGCCSSGFFRREFRSSERRRECFSKSVTSSAQPRGK